MSRMFSEGCDIERELSLLRDRLLPFEADLLRSILEAEGIEALLFGEGTIAAAADPGGVIRLVVPTSQLERAQSILSDYDQAEPLTKEES